MPGRSFTAQTNYRYGFNGKEKSDEISEGAISFEARIYDARIGRFFSTDPREAEYAWQSTYVYFKNCPTSLLDVAGMGGGDPPMVMSDRHNIMNFGELKKAQRVSGTSGLNITSIIINMEWCNKDVINGFFQEALGLAKEKGQIGNQEVTLSNGSKWNINKLTGHFFPIADDVNVVNLTNQEIAVLDDVCKNAIKNAGNPDHFKAALNRSMNLRELIPNENFQKAIGSASIRFTGSINAAVEVFESELLKPANEFPKDIDKKYNIKQGERNYVKFAGKNLLTVKNALGVAVVAFYVYEIVYSKDPKLEVVKSLAVGAAFSEGFAIGAAGTSWSGPGSLLGGLFGGIIAACIVDTGIDAIESAASYTVEELMPWKR